MCGSFKGIVDNSAFRRDPLEPEVLSLRARKRRLRNGVLHPPLLLCYTCGNIFPPGSAHGAALFHTLPSLETWKSNVRTFVVFKIGRKACLKKVYLIPGPQLHLIPDGKNPIKIPDVLLHFIFATFFNRKPPGPRVVAFAFNIAAVDYLRTRYTFPGRSITVFISGTMSHCDGCFTPLHNECAPYK